MICLRACDPWCGYVDGLALDAESDLWRDGQGMLQSMADPMQKAHLDCMK